MTDYSKELQQALRLADEADKIGMRYYLSRDLHIESKPDNSPVTQADLEIEKTLSQIVAEEFGDSYIGEEGANNGKSTRRWLVDPIDATKNFLRGYPVWGSLISLKEGENVLAACVSAPALGRRWWAVKNQGAFTRDIDGSTRQISVSKVQKLTDSFMLHGTFNSLKLVGIDPAKVFELMCYACRHRGPGDFLGYMYIAEGAADGYVEVPSALWDLEAPKFIVEQAGGSVWTNPDDMETIKLQRLTISSNGKIEQQILSYLNLN